MNRLRELRTEKKMTTRELADKLNTNRTTISRIEMGQTSLSDNMIKTICDFFNVTSDYLLCLSDERNMDSYLVPDDFLFALYGETKNLSGEEKQDILDIVKQAKKLMKK